MKILVLNCGSSSVKYELIQMPEESIISKGIVERVGKEDAILKYKTDKTVIEKKLPVKTHEEAISLILKYLTQKPIGVLESIEEIEAVGHRVVHGGEKYAQSVLITKDVEQAIEDNIRFAPLHNPANLAGIKAIENLLPKAPQVAVFDTAFHQSIPEEAYLYAIPYRYYSDMGIRRYGFHGTSHKYVAERAAEILGKKLEELKLITAHLGNGASITAIKNGKSIETSMGFTPLEGLVMGTRSGDIDPAIVLHIMQEENKSPEEMDKLLNKQSGLLGLSEISNDMREIEDLYLKGDARAKRAIEVFVHRLKKYIGAYAALLNGIDALIFTAGIGERSPLIRKLTCQNMEYLGIELDEELNQNTIAKENIISKGKTKVLVIPTNEELAIARDTYNIVKQS